MDINIHDDPFRRQTLRSRASVNVRASPIAIWPGADTAAPTTNTMSEPNKNPATRLKEPRPAIEVVHNGTPRNAYRAESVTWSILKTSTGSRGMHAILAISAP